MFTTETMRLSHLRAAVVEGEQQYSDALALQTLGHRKPEAGLVFGERGDQDGLGGGHKGG